MPTILCVSKILVMYTDLAGEVLEIDAEDGSLDKVSGIFETVFHGLAMRAVVDPQTPAEEGSASGELVENLRGLKNLHFE